MSLTQSDSRRVLALASSFYTAALESPFTAVLAREHKQLAVSCVPYNQLHTFLLEPNSVIQEDTSTTVLLLLRVEDLIRFELLMGAGGKAPDACLAVLRERTNALLNVLSRVSRLRLTVLMCPSGRGAYDVSFLGNSIRVSEFKIAAELHRQGQHWVMGWQDFESANRLQDCFNASADRLGHVPFSPAGLSALANFFVGQLDRMPITLLSRNTGASGSTDLEHFLSTLHTEMEVAPLGAQDEQKIIDLVRHTTHFINVPDGKEALDKLVAGTDHDHAWVVRVRDRFGDYGLSGAITFGIQGNVMQVDLLFLTCPVLGRQVEYAFLAWIAQLAEQRGARDIAIPFTPGRDNQGFHTLLANLTEADAAVESKARRFHLPVPGLMDRVLAQAPSPESVKSVVDNLHTMEAPLLRKVAT